MSIPINILYYNDLISEWILKSTSDYQETKDEYKYFRVLSCGKKYFYASAEDYFKFNNIELTDKLTNVKGEIILPL